MPDLGDLVPLAIQIHDGEGNLTNASTVSLTITQPDGTILTPTIANPPPDTGQYIADFVPTTPGRYTVRWVSTGPAAAFADTFDVRPATPGYIISLAEAKQYLNMTSTRDDDELRGWIETVTEVIERHRGETVARKTFTETVWSGEGASKIKLDHHPVISVDSIFYNNVSQLPESWYLDTEIGMITRVTGPRAQGYITISYTAGYTVIPSRFTAAAKIILGHLWSTQRVPTLGPTPTLRGGNREETIVTSAGEGYAIPSRAIELLGSRPSMIV